LSFSAQLDFGKLHFCVKIGRVWLGEEIWTRVHLCFMSKYARDSLQRRPSRVRTATRPCAQTVTYFITMTDRLAVALRPWLCVAALMFKPRANGPLQTGQLS